MGRNYQEHLFNKIIIRNLLEVLLYLRQIVNHMLNLINHFLVVEKRISILLMPIQMGDKKIFYNNFQNRKKEN